MQQADGDDFELRGEDTDDNFYQLKIHQDVGEIFNAK